MRSAISCYSMVPSFDMQTWLAERNRRHTITKGVTCSILFCKIFSNQFLFLSGMSTLWRVCMPFQIDFFVYRYALSHWNLKDRMSFIFFSSSNPKHIYRVVKKGAPGFEPGTSRSAVECSTTELYPQMKNFKQFWVLIGDNLNGYNQYKLRVKTFCKKKKMIQGCPSRQTISLI